MAALLIDPNHREYCGKTLGYNSRYIYDVDTTVLAEPTNRSVGDKGGGYYLIEMKGQACRNFEYRGGDWVAFFELLNTFPGLQFKRLDLAHDCFKFKDYKELDEYIRQGWYVSKFRQSRKTTERVLSPFYCVDDGFYNPLVIDTEKNNGKSYTFGTKQSVELQYYFKSAERRANGVEPLTNDWVRAEVRFCDDRSQNVFKDVLESFRAGTFSELISQILRGYLTFKDDCWTRICSLDIILLNF